jgi:hypothetical protein
VVDVVVDGEVVNDTGLCVVVVDVEVIVNGTGLCAVDERVDERVKEIAVRKENNISLNHVERN